MLLDPANIIIANGSGDEAGDGTDIFAGNNSDEAGSILSTPLNEIDDSAPTTIFESELEGLSGDTNVILQATNDITIEDLADDELTFASGSGIIAFTADADRDGTGDFVMEDSTVVDEETFDDADTIRTNGRNIAISGANLTIGSIDTSLDPIDNAGDTIESAQNVSSGSGVSLESITGSLSETDSADVYQIFITGNGTFSATTVDGTNIDTQLFLFDAGGFGIYGNDDAASCGGCFQSTLPAENDLAPTILGIYYLAVSQFEVEPVSEGGRIFPDAFDTEPADFESIVTPTGSGGNSPFIGFDSEGFEIGNYTINLTGVEGTEATFTEAPQINTGENSGSINLNANNGGISFANLISSNNFSDVSGNINVNATGDITSINGRIDAFGGNINITAGQAITFVDHFLNTNNFNLGNADDISITAGSTITLTDTDIDASVFGDSEANPDNSSRGLSGGNITISAREAIFISNGDIRTDNFGGDEAGDIVIESTGGSVELFGETETFEDGLSFTSTISTTTDSNLTGKTGGDIKITSNSITIDNYHLDASVNFGSGNGGNIFITGDSVDIKNNSWIASETFAEGNAGSIFVNATNDGNFNLTNNSSITTISNGAGNAGEITVNAGTIFLGEGAEISAEVGEDFSSSDFVDSELFLFDAQGNVLAENDDSDPAIGNAGSDSGLDSFIEYPFAEEGTYVIGVGAFDSFAEPGSISGNSIATGQNYTLQVSVENQLTNTGADGLVTKAEPNNSLDTAQNINNSFSTNENINIQDSTSIPHVSISAEGDGTFDYYSFDATAGSLGIFDIDETSFSDNTVVQPGNVQAGNINLNATGDITIADNSIVSASTEGRGFGGSVNITTPNLLTIRDNSRLEVDSEGLATGGNLVINSDSLTLENQGQISAKTASGKGGLLDINVDDTLSMRNNSTITAEAEGTGDGGNIDIDAKFVIAFPNQNNDIVTNAQSGTGGNIRIITEALLGLDTRSSIPENTTNDIDVSSQSGLSGDFTLSVLNTDFLQGKVQLPDNFIESEQTVAQACRGDHLAQQPSGLTIEGKGGIAADPTSPFGSDLLVVDGTIATPNSQAQNTQRIKTSIGDITPARGIIKTEDGQVILTAYPTDKIDTRTPHVSANCS